MVLTTWRIIAICASGAAVEYGWATGEATIIPHLIDLGLPLTTASMVYLVNPIMGFFMAPAIGTNPNPKLQNTLSYITPYVPHPN